jgi:hypothetical protein
MKHARKQTYVFDYPKIQFIIYSTLQCYREGDAIVYLECNHIMIDLLSPSV